MKIIQSTQLTVLDQLFVSLFSMWRPLVAAALVAVYIDKKDNHRIT